MAGKNVDFAELLTLKYLGSANGSSLAELTQASKDFGMYALPARDLTSQVLRSSHYPVILHVKKSADSTKYDHYELFLGVENGLARLYDPPDPVRLVPFRELAPRWNGTGLIVSAQPIDTGKLFAPAYKSYVQCAAIALAVIALASSLRKPWLPLIGGLSRRGIFALSAMQCIGLMGVSLLAGMVYHFATDEGLLAHANATEAIEKAHVGDLTPKVSKAEVGQLLNTATVLIDARFASDFNAGHLPNAINVSIDSSDDQRHKVMAGIAKDAKIVVYCQSLGCKFAAEITAKLLEDGFSNVSIFKGGWHEWETKKGK